MRHIILRFDFSCDAHDYTLIDLPECVIALAVFSEPDLFRWNIGRNVRTYRLPETKDKKSFSVNEKISNEFSSWLLCKKKGKR